MPIRKDIFKTERVKRQFNKPGQKKEKRRTMQHIIKLLIMDRKQSLEIIGKKTERVRVLTNSLDVLGE